MMDVSPRKSLFLRMTSSKAGSILFSLVSISAHILDVDNQAYNITYPSTNLCFRSDITFLSVLVEICLVEATDSRVDSESVKIYMRIL